MDHECTLDLQHSRPLAQEDAEEPDEGDDKTVASGGEEIAIMLGRRLVVYRHKPLHEASYRGSSSTSHADLFSVSRENSACCVSIAFAARQRPRRVPRDGVTTLKACTHNTASSPPAALVDGGDVSGWSRPRSRLMHRSKLCVLEGPIARSSRPSHSIRTRNVITRRRAFCGSNNGFMLASSSQPRSTQAQRWARRQPRRKSGVRRGRAKP